MKKLELRVWLIQWNSEVRNLKENYKIVTMSFYKFVVTIFCTLKYKTPIGKENMTNRILN